MSALALIGLCALIWWAVVAATIGGFGLTVALRLDQWGEPVRWGSTFARIAGAALGWQVFAPLLIGSLISEQADQDFEA